MTKKIKSFRIPYKRILYSICFCMFCIIDQRIRTAYGLNGWLETFRDMTGVVMAVIILSHYKFMDFIKWKIPYMIWSAVGGCMGTAAFLWGLHNECSMNDWFIQLLDVFLFGYIVIHIVIDLAIEKKGLKLNKKFAFLWLLMMLLMIVSRNEQIWPLCYMIMFGCFYLTGYDEAEQEDLLQGMLNGVILGFFVIQGLAFVFRPYDEVRYKGSYFNTNMNALLYLEVLAAVLSKLLYVKKEAAKWIKVYYWLGVGVVLAFLFMTVGRTAWVTAFILSLVFLWAGKKGKEKRSILKQGMLMILCACITFPLCFGAARYIPPLFHHPVWYGNEWNENRVHSWDPWDSEKYVNIDEFMDFVVGRLLGSIKIGLKESPFMLKAAAAEIETEEKAAADDAWESMEIRREIYKYYITHLNLWGNAKRGNDKWGYHGHNILLQYGTDFGVVVLALFIIIYIWSLLLFVRRFLQSKDEKYIVFLLFSLITILYGMLEITWGAGSISMLMMFFLWGNVIRLDADTKMSLKSSQNW